MNFFKKTPLAISGVALALVALGNLLLPLPYGMALHVGCGVLSGVILCLFLIRVISDFKQVKEELKSPIALGVLPTSTMALMLICAYTFPFLGFVAVWLWYVFVVVHVLIVLLFIKRFVLKPKLENVYPSWFVPGVGIIIICITSETLGTQVVGSVFFYLGALFYVCLLPITLYRMIKLRPLPEPARPLAAIFVAPPGLCLVGYLTLYSQPIAWIVYVLTALMCVSYLVVAVRMVWLLRLKFYPSYAAFTFPFVVSATGMRAAAGFFSESGYDVFSYIAPVIEGIAVLMIIYVLIRYVMFYFSGSKAK